MNDLTSIKRYDGLTWLVTRCRHNPLCHFYSTIWTFVRNISLIQRYGRNTFFFGICWVKLQLHPSAVRILWYIQMMPSHSNNYLIPLIMLVNSCHHGCVYVCVYSWFLPLSCENPLVKETLLIILILTFTEIVAVHYAEVWWSHWRIPRISHHSTQIRQVLCSSNMPCSHLPLGKILLTKCTSVCARCVVAIYNV